MTIDINNIFIEITGWSSTIIWPTTLEIKVTITLAYTQHDCVRFQWRCRWS